MLLMAVGSLLLLLQALKLLVVSHRGSLYLAQMQIALLKNRRFYISIHANIHNLYFFSLFLFHANTNLTVYTSVATVSHSVNAPFHMKEPVKEEPEKKEEPKFHAFSGKKYSLRG